MSDIQITGGGHTPLINATGSLPHSVDVPIESNGSAALYVSGSVWTQKQDALIGIAVSVNGTQVGTATIWSNGPATHRAVVPIFIPIMLDAPWTGDPAQPPTYTFELSALNGDTISDVNDSFQLMLVM